MQNGVTLFQRLVAIQPAAAHSAAEESDTIVVPRLVAGWLAAGPQVFRGDARRRLDAICRQIDVRHRLSMTYRDDWKRVETETAVTAETLAGVVAVLLANAGPIGREGSDGDGGWGLKCTNSALKALDLMETVPAAPELRAWAVAVLDDRTRPTASPGEHGEPTS